MFSLFHHLARTNRPTEPALHRAHTGNRLALVYHRQRALKAALGLTARRSS